MSQSLADREERHQRIQVRDRCLRKAVQLAGELDDITDSQVYNKTINTISALSQLSIAISMRDANV